MSRKPDHLSPKTGPWPALGTIQRLDCGIARRREAEIVVTVREGFRASEERLNLRVPAGMTAPEELPLFGGEVPAIVAHDRARLRGEVRGGAYQHHGLQAIGLHGGDVKQDVAASADAGGFARIQLQVR